MDWLVWADCFLRKGDQALASMIASILLRHHALLGQEVLGSGWMISACAAGDFCSQEAETQSGGGGGQRLMESMES